MGQGSTKWATKWAKQPPPALGGRQSQDAFDPGDVGRDASGVEAAWASGRAGNQRPGSGLGLFIEAALVEEGRSESFAGAGQVIRPIHCVIDAGELENSAILDEDGSGGVAG